MYYLRDRGHDITCRGDPSTSRCSRFDDDCCGNNNNNSHNDSNNNNSNNCNNNNNNHNNVVCPICMLCNNCAWHPGNRTTIKDRPYIIVARKSGNRGETCNADGFGEKNRINK